MAGGRGERFWPQSRLTRPKHLLPIVGEKPMLTQTIERLGKLVPPENVIIVTNKEQQEAVSEVCPMVPVENIVAEPVGRDTAAAVGLSSILVKHRDPEAAFAMLPADHVIHDSARFQQVLDIAFRAAEAEDALVTVGIKPDHPATGYGYIQRGKSVSTIEGRDVFNVTAFREKPDEATAREYMDAGNFYWNAGMFFWRVPVIEGAMKKLTPKLWSALEKIDQGLSQGEKLEELLETHYPGLEKISVDYAIMEKADAVRVVESDFDWDDVGSWPAVERHFQADDQGNVLRGSVEIEGSENNIVINSGKRLTALVGVKDLVIVETEDATLVCSKEQAQDIKNLVKKLGENPDHKDLLI